MLDEAQELALIRSVLVDTFPEESRRVGKTNLNDIVRRRGQVRIVPMSGASRLEWTESLILLANSAALLSHALTYTRNSFDSRHGGKTEIHFHQENHVIQKVRIGRVDGESSVSVGTPIEFTIPPEVAGKLDATRLEALVTALVSHLDAEHGRGSSAAAPR
jgi:hypothetical protein